MPGLPGSPECMWLLTLKFPTNVFRLWKKMDNRNKFGFWFPGCCRLGFVKLDFGSRDVLHNCQLLKCNFLSENNAASSFLIRKRKIKYKWHHPPHTDEKPFCGSFNGKNSTLFSPYQKPPPLWRLRPSRVLALQTCLPAGLAHPSFKLFLHIWVGFKNLSQINALLAPGLLLILVARKRNHCEKDREP